MTSTMSLPLFADGVASTAICGAAPPAQKMALGVVHNEKHESNLIGRAPE